MDIGYHFDLTGMLLAERGFGQTAIDVALFANGMTDIIGNLPSDLGWEPLIAAKRLHCDNLFNHTDITNYWKQFLGNTKRELETCRDAFKSADATADTKQSALIKGLFVIGIAFHVVQDLCSHSNWCELLPKAETFGKVGDANPRIKKYFGRSMFKANNPMFDHADTSDFFTGVYSDYYEWNQRAERGADEFAKLVAKPELTPIEQAVKDWLKENLPGVQQKAAEINPWFEEWKPYKSDMKNHPDHGHPAHGDDDLIQIIDRLINGPEPTVHIDPPNEDVAQNLDHQDRRIRKSPEARTTHWDEAYVTAYSTAKHLLNEMHEVWLGTDDPAKAFREAMKTVNLSLMGKFQFERLFDTVKGLAHAIAFSHQDGHWKGPHSGSWVDSLITLSINGTLLWKTRRAAILFDLFGAGPESAPTLVQLYWTLMDKNSLAKNLYSLEKMGVPANNHPVITQVPPTDPFRVVTLTVNRVVVPTEKDGSFPFRPRMLDVLTGPDLYLTVHIRSYKADDGSVHSEVMYRERTLQDVQANAAGEWVSPSKPDDFGDGEPWQVVHIVPDGVARLEYTLRLFDKDPGLDWNDDELRLNTNKDAEADGVMFTVILPATTGVSESLGDGNLNVSPDNDPKPIHVVGTRGSFWSGPPATLNFYFTVATVDFT